MAADTVNICNQALLLLGEAKIQSLEEDTVQARACSVFYPTARDAVVADIKPNFAVKRSGELPAAANPEMEYTKAHGVPQDCANVLSVWSGTTRLRDWRVEGRTVVSHHAVVKVRYISLAGDLEARMDGAFVQALAAYLAGLLAYTLTNARPKLADMITLYEQKKAQAENQYGQESSTQPVHNDQLTRVR